MRIMKWVLCAVLAAMAAAASPFQARVEATGGKEGGVAFRLTVSVPKGNHIYESAFSVKALPGATAKLSPLPAATREKDPQTGEMTGVYASDIVVNGVLSPNADGSGLEVSYQGCDAMQCFMPETHSFKWNASAKRFIGDGESGAAASANAPRDWLQGRTLVSSGGYQKTAAFMAFLDRVEGKATARETGLKAFLGDPLLFFRTYGMWLTLLLVLAGGALLNLTPCVLPMMPINLAIIGAGSMAGGKKRGFLFGGAYGFGMAAAYGVLGWLVLKSGLFMGSIQSSPWFNGAMALIFAALALSLFGLFPIEFNRFLRSGRKASKKGILTAFAAGALSAVLAGACVAPVVLAVLLLAGSLAAEGHASAQFLPFVLGVGMALPWPFAGAGLSVLPKPGAWMNRVKQVFAVALLLLAAYYGVVAAKGFGLALKRDDVAAVPAGDYKAWLEKLAKADREGKPIFVDCWATWCKNCEAMNATTFRDAKVRKRLEGYYVIGVQAEKPNEPDARSMLDALGVKGLPGYGVLRR